MSSTKPYLRMKAVLMMYKVFLRYPEALRPAFPKLKEKLEDPDPGMLLYRVPYILLFNSLLSFSLLLQVYNRLPLMSSVN